MSAKSKQSKRLVVDASIARASGGPHAAHPSSKHCRDFLKDVRGICHRMILSPEIQQEWNRHQSAFARQWRTSMVARKKIDVIQSPQNDVLRQQIHGAIIDPKKKSNAAKDVHLIEAAVVSDHIVVSLDDKVRTIFHEISDSVSVLKDISWANPNNFADQSREWLEAGAPKRKRLLLSSPTLK